MDFLNSLFVSLTKVLVTLFLLINAGLAFVSEKYLSAPPISVSITATTTLPTPKIATPTIVVHATTTKTTATVFKRATPLPTAKTPPQETPSVNQEELNTQTRLSVVNILCRIGNNSFHSISGSGIIVDTRGVVLTNAHVGQFFLLRDYPTPDNVDCVIRTGSPAQPRYRAKLLYLPPAWIDTNASQINKEQATGTGEGDYAFLLITSTTDPSGTLPSSFSTLPMSASDPGDGTSVLLTAYPAGFLDGISIEKNLYVTSAFTSVQKLYTFNDTTKVDLISVRGTVVSQGGSSGGAVVRTDDGKLTGVIVTDTSASTTAERDLRAITLSYINRDLMMNNKGGVAGLLLQDLQSLATTFATTIGESEKKKLIDALK